jgi:hypothetical protein
MTRRVPRGVRNRKVTDVSEPPDEQPGWSLTWLFRLQRRGRRKPRPTEAREGSGGTGFQWFSWIVLALLVIEVAVLVYQGFLPR